MPIYLTTNYINFTFQNLLTVLVFIVEEFIGISENVELCVSIVISLASLYIKLQQKPLSYCLSIAIQDF